MAKSVGHLFFCARVWIAAKKGHCIGYIKLLVGIDQKEFKKSEENKWGKKEGKCEWESGDGKNGKVGRVT